MAHDEVRYRLRMGWVFLDTLVLPLVALLIVLGVLATTAWTRAHVPDEIAWVLLGAMAVLLLVRIPLFVYTVARDRDLVLGASALRVPVCGRWQLRPWTIPWSEIASVELTRRGPGATWIAIALRGGRVRRFDATLVADRHAVLAALRARASASSSRRTSR